MASNRSRTRKAGLRNVSTPVPARSICSARTSTCARAGGSSTPITWMRPSPVRRATADHSTNPGRAMATLNIEPNITQFDDFYEALIETHRDIDATQSQMVNAKLILLLANHIGDLNVLREAMRHARAGVMPAQAST